MLFISTTILSRSLAELYGNLWQLEEHFLAQASLLDAGPATALRLRPLGLAAGQPRAAPEAGRLLDQAGLLALRLRRAGAAGLAGDGVGPAQPQAQQRVLLRPRVRHGGLLVRLSYGPETDTAGPEGPAVSLVVLEGSPPRGGDRVRPPCGPAPWSSTRPRRPPPAPPRGSAG